MVTFPTKQHKLEFEFHTLCLAITSSSHFTYSKFNIMMTRLMYHIIGSGRKYYSIHWKFEQLNEFDIERGDNLIVN